MNNELVLSVKHAVQTIGFIWECAAFLFICAAFTVFVLSLRGGRK